MRALLILTLALTGCSFQVGVDYHRADRCAKAAADCRTNNHGSPQQSAQISEGHSKALHVNVEGSLLDSKPQGTGRSSTTKAPESRPQVDNSMPTNIVHSAEFHVTNYGVMAQQMFVSPQTLPVESPGPQHRSTADHEEAERLMREHLERVRRWRAGD